MLSLDIKICWIQINELKWVSYSYLVEDIADRSGQRIWVWKGVGTTISVWLCLKIKINQRKMQNSAEEPSGLSE